MVESDRRHDLEEMNMSRRNIAGQTQNPLHAGYGSSYSKRANVMTAGAGIEVIGQSSSFIVIDAHFDLVRLIAIEDRILFIRQINIQGIFPSKLDLNNLSSMYTLQDE